jgi:catechol 2,3-dioxygenase-like lactoylglutathione lyase family enzyme
MQADVVTPNVKDFRPFLICNPDNYEYTKAFYTDLGFRQLWDDGDSACEFTTGFGNQRFLVTLHHGLEPTRNAMLHFWVEDAKAWYDHAAKLKLEERYPGVTITTPAVTDWGWLITYVTDPSGVLLHFAEPHSEDNKAFFNNAEWIAKAT